MSRVGPQVDTILVSDECAARLAVASSALLGCRTGADIYGMIGDLVVGLVPGSAAIVNEVSEDGCEFIVKEVAGLDDEQGARIADIFGISAPESRWRMSADVRAAVLTGVVSRVPGGIAHLVFGDVPAELEVAVAQLLGSYDVFTVGISDGERALAAVHIVVRAPDTAVPYRILESFACQCFTALRGIQAAEDLDRVARADTLLFTNMVEGFAVHQIVTESDGRAVDYRFLKANPAFESMVGLPCEEIIGRTVLELFPGTEQSWIERYATVARTGICARFEDYSGELDKHFRVSAFSPQPGQFATFVTDITARKQAEAALLASEEEHLAVVKTAMDGFWIADLAGHLVEVNEAYAEMSGYSEQELLCMRISDLEAALTPRETAASLKMIASRGGDRFESRHRRKDGSVFDVEVSVQDRLTENGRQAAFVRDISQRKHSEALLLRHRARLRSLAAELSTSGETERRRLGVELHDGIGQILASAKIAAQLVAAEKLEDLTSEQAHRLIKLIEEAISEVRVLTSEVALPVLFELGFESALLWLTDRYFELYGLKCTIEIDRQTADLHGESAMFLFRVVREGLNNVVRHSGVSEAFVAAEHVGEWRTISITDAGGGFDPAVIDEPGDAGGFGLFSIREECIDRGGALHIGSGPAGGTRIRARIPDCSPLAVVSLGQPQSRAESLAARQDFPYVAS